MTRMVMVAVAVVAAVVVLGAFAIDQGEVITLITAAPGSGHQDTQLWTVEIDEVHYLRASSPNVAWLARLRERPLVEIDFGGLRAHYRAIPLNDDTIRDRVNERMALKYGFADRLWATLGDRSASIPIRLEPAGDLLSARGDSS